MIWEGLEVWETLGLGLRAEWDITPLMGASDAREADLWEKRVQDSGKEEVKDAKVKLLIAGKGGGLWVIMVGSWTGRVGGPYRVLWLGTMTSPVSCHTKPGIGCQECWESNKFSRMGSACIGAQGGMVAVGWTVTELCSYSLVGSQCSWKGDMFPWTVSAPSSVGMSQMLECAFRGLGTWPETGPLGTEVWVSGSCR